MAIKPPEPAQGDLPFDFDEIRRQLKSLPKKDLLDVARSLGEMERRLQVVGPQTDEDLWAFIKKDLGYHIPRVAVCPDHQAPFTALADLYFYRTTSALMVGNRGGAKTFLVALLWYITNEFREGVEGLTVGAVEQQSKRCYSYLQKMLAGKEDKLANQVQSETLWKHGGKVEIVPGTVGQVNGPHPNIAHADEIELMAADVFSESRNMSSSTVVNGRHYPAQDICTSTRKWISGPVQKLIEEIKKALMEGRKPDYDLYIWCIFETAAPVSNCQAANPDLPDDQKCDCHTIEKGKWDDGSRRLFSQECKGRLARSDGWIPLAEVQKKFQANTKEVWDAQQACVKPTAELMVVPRWDRNLHCIRKYVPHPDNGPIYMCIDFGGTNPHAVNWYQVLTFATEVTDYSGNKRVLKEGTRVCFDEVYKAEVGNTQGPGNVASLIVARERLWRQIFPRWRVRARFADPQAKAARLDFRAYDPPLPTVWWGATRDVKEHIKVVNSLVDDELFVVDVERCPMFSEEIESWHFPPPKPGMTDDPEKPVEDFDHCMSNWRYCMVNLDAQKRRGKGPGTGSAGPATDDGKHTTSDIDPHDARMILPESVGGGGLPASEAWRHSFQTSPGRLW